ncbi:protein-L-isoaspartate O-methyltransferase [Phycicoccus sp. Root563]|uniref:protein-L-isoaspartate O-methyltransferase family protein n=1 Tax=Phycicoccus sp. Root563 TaxID=1736562 RepID=UPI000B0E5BE7|nr:protein-L-isoaspartate carboxylmethyltransferase [Phycicoccus sp. Root563]
MASAHERVAAALEAMPRVRFLPRDQVARAGQDTPLPIGHGQTNSQPTTVRQVLELLDVHEGDTVLDVGSGSGWTTALLARLTGPTGSVVGVERVPALVTVGAAHLADAGVPWARVEPAAPGVLGRPSEGPYNRILVSAQASRLPHELVAQLAPEGVLVVPVRGRMLRVRATGADLVVEEHGWYRFVPLVEDRAPTSS